MIILSFDIDESQGVIMRPETGQVSECVSSLKGVLHGIVAMISHHEKEVKTALRNSFHIVVSNPFLLVYKVFEVVTDSVPS